MLEKLKSFLLNDHIFFGFMVILVGITSFFLGQASVVPISTNQPKLSQKGDIAMNSLNLINSSQNEAVNEPAPVNGSEESIVASKSGTKYHLTSCPGAKQIKIENKITFTSRQAAEAAGYKPAANCPQLQ